MVALWASVMPSVALLAIRDGLADRIVAVNSELVVREPDEDVIETDDCRVKEIFISTHSNEFTRREDKDKVYI